MRKESVCAVVVTYNRKDLLLECLEALRKQTRPINATYLIDNASTDGTPELLKEKGYIQELPPENLVEPWEKEFKIKNLMDGQVIKLHYVRMHENTGGAGGFHEGVKRAYEKGYDWLWLMDDDVEPLEHALERFFDFTHLSKCIHPSRILPNGGRLRWGGCISLETGYTTLLESDENFWRNKEFTCVNFGCFEGMFIHREIVRDIGFPRKEFFLIRDDTHYGYLASQYTLNIYIRDVLLKKKVDTHRGKLYPFKMYLAMRNSIYVSRLVSRNKSLWLMVTSFKFARSLGSAILKHRSFRLALAAIVGCFDGLFGVFGREKMFM